MHDATRTHIGDLIGVAFMAAFFAAAAMTALCSTAKMTGWSRPTLGGVLLIATCTCLWVALFAVVRLLTVVW